MPFIEVPNVAMAQLIFQQESQFIENTLYFEKDGGWTPTTMGVLAGLVVDWWKDNLQPHLTDRMHFLQVIVNNLASESAPGIIYTTGLPDTGSVSGHDLPLNVTMAVSFRTGLRGRSYRGRNYLCGMIDTGQAHSTIDPTYLSSIKTAYEALITEVEPEGIEWVVVSRYHNKAPRTTGVASQILTVSVDSTTDSQRRRLPGRGA